MTFSLADEQLSRQMTGQLRSPVADHLGLRLVRFARGVAVYEMPVRRHACDPLGRVEKSVLTALAEAAMAAAARTIVPDGDAPPDAIGTCELSAQFLRPVELHEAQTLRAEAIVMRRNGAVVNIEADVLHGGTKVAAFAATCASGSSTGWSRPDLHLAERAVA